MENKYVSSYIYKLVINILNDKLETEIEIEFFLNISEAHKTLLEIKNAVVDVCLFANSENLISNSLTTTVSKSSLDVWGCNLPDELQEINSCDVLTKFKITLSNQNSFNNVIEQLRKPQRLIFVIGDNKDALDLYDNWCLQDEQSIAQFLLWEQIKPDETATMKRFYESTVPLVLVGGAMMPLPTIRVTLDKPRLMQDMYNKQYTIYSMSVRYRGLEWVVEKRYSDFTKLHESLLSQPADSPGHVLPSTLPRLPSKKLTVSRSLDANVVEKRLLKLGKYINQLVTLEPALSNHLVLSFIGLLNTARFDSVNHQKGRSRNAIHISKLKTEARAGDIILFKCANTLSHLQRKVTQSEWDHVGIVVPSVRGSAHSSGGLDLLEATGEGVTSYPLIGRLKAYHVNQFTKYMCIRKLSASHVSAIDANRKLAEYVRQVVGTPYGFTASEAFIPKYSDNAPKATKKSCLKWCLSSGEDDNANSNNDKSKSVDRYQGGASVHGPLSIDRLKDNRESLLDDETIDENETFFCSELVAAALKEIDILPSYLNAGFFWPGSFAIGGEIDVVLQEKTPPCSYGAEYIIDCRTMEISRAVSASSSEISSPSPACRFREITLDVSFRGGEFKAPLNQGIENAPSHGLSVCKATNALATSTSGSSAPSIKHFLPDNLKHSKVENSLEETHENDIDISYNTSLNPLNEEADDDEPALAAPKATFVPTMF